MRHRLAISLVSLLLPASIALGQQSYVGQYDVYAGYMYLHSSLINLGETGYHTQIGTNPAKWYSVGFDFSSGSGDIGLVPTMLKGSLQQEIGAQLAPLIAAGMIPANWPDLGAIHESTVPHPGDPIGSLLAAQLAPSGNKTDWTYFYGFGGGVDFNVTKNFALRVQADFVRDHLYSDLLNSRNSVRLSVGPAFHFGKNVVAR
jgi:hypothetical protein